jgi:hypothetical protein
MLLSLSLVLLVAGCSLDVALDTRHLGCADGRCPSGFSCGSDFLCHDGTPGGDDGGVPEAPDAAPSTGPCGQVTLLADDFEVSPRHPQWSGAYQNPGVTMAQTGGRLRITLPSGSSSFAYGGYVSSRFYQLTDSQIAADIPHSPSVTSSAEVYLAALADLDGTRLVLISEQSNQLHFVVRDPAGNTSSTLPYDPVQHRHMRLRESGGTLFFETAPDGSTWTTRKQVATPFSLDLVRIEIASGVPQPEAAPGFAELESVNAGVPAGRYCKTATITEDFSGTAGNTRWYRTAQGQACKVGQLNGTFVGTPPGPGDAEEYCGYESSTGYDLTGSDLSIEVVEMVNPLAKAIAYFKAADERNDHGVELSQEDDLLHCRRWIGGVRSEVGQLPWDAAAFRYWRLGEGGGRLLWQTSADGSTWITRCSCPTSEVDVHDVDVVFGVGSSGAPSSAPAPGTFRLDRLNLLP